MSETTSASSVESPQRGMAPRERPVGTKGKNADGERSFATVTCHTDHWRDIGRPRVVTCSSSVTPEPTLDVTPFCRVTSPNCNVTCFVRVTRREHFRVTLKSRVTMRYGRVTPLKEVTRHVALMSPVRLR